MPYRVLIVEDHPVMRAAYARVLAREADFEVCAVFGSAEEALAAFDGAAFNGAACDLVVADVRLPGMDGIEMVELLRARQPSLAVLVISGYEEEAFAKRALAAGANAYLNKKGLERTLATAIREAIGGRDGHRPQAPPVLSK